MQRRLRLGGKGHSDLYNLRTWTAGEPKFFETNLLAYGTTI